VDSRHAKTTNPNPLSNYLSYEITQHICAMSLEGLIDALERYNTGVQIVRPWQA
jgi:hypothetical protein